MLDIRTLCSMVFLFFCTSLLGQQFYKGVDLSYVNELEECGATYKSRSGDFADAYSILSDEGANIVRLRLWHNPQWTAYSNLEDVKKSIARAKTNGMKVMLDFHYSDFWTDPGRNWRPAAWEEVETDALLGDSVYNYTRKVLLELSELSLLPEFVQIGNETNGNILQPLNGASTDSGSPGLYPVNWTRQVGLLQRGIDAVNDLNVQLSVDLKTIIHVANPLDAQSWFQSAISNGLHDFDIIGLSYYPQWHELGVREVGESVAKLKNDHNKEVMIVEIGYPWTPNNGHDQANDVLGWDSRLFTYSNTFSIETQRDFLIELTWLVKENGGIGVVYWEPAWISTSCQTYWATGSHWENATLFDYDGKIHAGADFLSYDYEIKPANLDDQQVTFLVDMTNVDTKDGVFVTGDFTGESWQFMPMNLTTGSLYEYSTSLPGRSEGAYIFYNNNDWSSQYRETVPEACARVWNTHREFWVKGEEATFHFSWGRCDQLPNEAVLGVESYSSICLFPTSVQRELNITSDMVIQSIELFDLKGDKYPLSQIGDEKWDVGQLTSGLYFVRVGTAEGTQTLRFIKE